MLETHFRWHYLWILFVGFAGSPLLPTSMVDLFFTVSLCFLHTLFTYILLGRLERCSLCVFVVDSVPASLCSPFSCRGVHSGEWRNNR